jgi:aminoglycoside 6-adenylyltransferase
MTHSSRREQLLRQIITWAESRADILAVVLVGSGARLDLPADEWSDIDLVLVAADPSAYLGSDAWCAAIDEPWIGTLERGPDGQIVERRVLFRSGIDADFIVISSDLRALQTEPLQSITARGMRVLLDKDMLLCGLTGEERQAAAPQPPSRAEFAELVNDFWFHAVWAAKKIRRGELWTAKSCCDGYMKRLLLAMIEWRAQPSGAAIWYSGRFIERWAGADVVARLGSVFAHYDEADIWRALIQTMELFAAISRQTAQRLGYAYPDEQARGISAWVKEKLEAG